MGSVSQSFFRLFRGHAGESGSSAAAAPATQPRRSSALSELMKSIKGQEGLSILDLGPTSPTNISYFTAGANRMQSEDVLLASFGPEYRTHDEAGTVTVDAGRFLNENLSFSGKKFDVVLAWDMCDYLAEPLVKPVVERLHAVMNPGGYLLAFFHTRDAGPDAPYFRYHIDGNETLKLQRGPQFQLQRIFNNRHVENLFRDYGSLKFFLARDNVREVLVAR
jgi:hypothetical protein